MNLLIVDDEPLIHVSIEYSLKELGIPDLQVVHANNGTEMIHRMEEMPIDIAFVDIRMPGTDGLTAIGIARQHWPETTYFIMSGFSEFEYAREAVHLEVADYLLKPLDPKQLAEIIERKQKEQTQRQEQLRESFHAWLVGTLHKHNVSPLYDHSYYSSIVLFCCDGKVDFEDYIPEEFRNVRAEHLSIPCWEGILMHIYDRDKEVLKTVLNAFPSRLPDGMTCCVSPISNDPEDLAMILHQMLDLSPGRIFRGIGQRYTLQQFTGLKEADIESGKAWIELRNHYREKQYTEYMISCSGLIPTLANQSAFRCRQLAAFLEVVTGIEIREPYNEASIRQCLNDAGEMLLQQENSSDKLDAVIEYVQENFCKDITIANISARFDLTPNYLSTLFKKKMGINFIDYLVSLRIAEAKRLLVSGNRSIKEISEAVGYYSQSYFTKVFLKKEGCTPGEYKARKNSSDV